MENNPGQSANQENRSVWQNIREWIQVIVIALLISLPIRFFVAEPFVVKGASMDPTFSTGQFLIVDRLTYRFSEPSRGDVIIFKYPNNPKVYYIKRIVGLPGETVKMNGGKVSIVNNDNPSGFSLSEPFIDPDHVSKDTITAKLGDTQYFVMGDNRAESMDSRAWGPLDRSLIIGRPFVRLIPLSKVSIFPGEYAQ